MLSSQLYEHSGSVLARCTMDMQLVQQGYRQLIVFTCTCAVVDSMLILPNAVLMCYSTIAVTQYHFRARPAAPEQKCSQLYHDVTRYTLDPAGIQRKYEAFTRSRYYRSN